MPLILLFLTGGQMEGNMAGSIPKDQDSTHDFREPVNPEATGAAMGAKVLKQNANFAESSYDGKGNGKSAAL